MSLRKLYKRLKEAGLEGYDGEFIVAPRPYDLEGQQLEVAIVLQHDDQDLAVIRFFDEVDDLGAGTTPDYELLKMGTPRYLVGKYPHWENTAALTLVLVKAIDKALESHSYHLAYRDDGLVAAWYINGLEQPFSRFHLLVPWKK